MVNYDKLRMRFLIDYGSNWKIGAKRSIKNRSSSVEFDCGRGGGC